MSLSLFAEGEGFGENRRERVASASRCVSLIRIIRGTEW
jgi:hypothetical protein